MVVRAVGGNQGLNRDMTANVDARAQRLQHSAIGLRYPK